MVGQRDCWCATPRSLGAGYLVIVLGIAHTSSVLSKVLACHLLVASLGPFTSRIKGSHVEERELTLKDASHALGTLLTAYQIQTAQPFS